MPWIERPGGVRAHFKGKDTPEVRGLIDAILDALSAGAHCDLATRTVHCPEMDALKLRDERRRMAEEGIEVASFDLGEGR